MRYIKSTNLLLRSYLQFYLLSRYHSYPNRIPPTKAHCPESLVKDGKELLRRYLEHTDKSQAKVVAMMGKWAALGGAWPLCTC